MLIGAEPQRVPAMDRVARNQNPANAAGHVNKIIFMRVKKLERHGHSMRNRSVFARSASAVAAILSVTGLMVVGMSASFADPAPTQTTFVADSFTGATAGSGYTLPSAPASSGRSGEVNGACLTASSNLSVTANNSIPGCGGTPDADGSGALRLTSAQTYQTGGVGVNQSVPTAQGIDASFDSYQYNGTTNWAGKTGDGIVFYLAATDPYNPVVPTQIGQLGGSLGYSNSSTGGTGLAHAYLGLGLDRYGNFVTSGAEGSDCSGSFQQPYPENVTVRGPGDGTTGYCIVATTAGSSFTGTLSTTGSRADATVPVEIVVNPTSSPLSAQKHPSVTVQGGHFAVIFTPIGGPQQVLTGALPTLSLTGNDANIPASWIDPTTGYPYKLTYGWASGTGSATDIHEVNYFQAKSLAGPVPVLAAVTGGDTTVSHAGSGTYTVTPTVTSGGGPESRLIRTTTTFPSDLQPVAPPSSGTGWSCSLSGQVETCDYAVGQGSSLQPGTDLPALSLPYTVSGSAGSVTIQTVVASTDAEAVTVTHSLVVQKQSVRITAANLSVEYGATATLTANVASGELLAPTLPTGIVSFTDSDSGNVLCTAAIVSGAASCTIAAYPVGNHTILVGYGGDSDHATVTGASEPQFTLAVTAVPTTLALASAKAVYGTPTVLSATGLPSDAKGTLTFVSGGTTLCSATLPGTSCLTSTTLPVGTYEVESDYSGDSIYGASSSAPALLTIGKVPTTLSVNPIVSEPFTTLTVSGLPTAATGTVAFRSVDGSVLCSVTLPGTSCTTETLVAGINAITASYSGDTTFAPSQVMITVAIAPDPTSVLANTGSIARIGAGAVLVVAFAMTGSILLVGRRRHRHD